MFPQPSSGDVEIIVVDDGSEDGTEEVASGYTKKDPRVRLIRQDNKGLAAARNRGLAEAGSEYVGFLGYKDAYKAAERLWRDGMTPLWSTRYEFTSKRGGGGGGSREC